MARTAKPAPPALERRSLGRSGIPLTILGLGTRRLAAAGQQAFVRVVRSAIDGGVNVLEVAPEYAEGRAERWLGLALRDGYRARVHLVWQCCAHLRDYKTSMAQLEQTLQLLRTDHVDLWSFHELGYDNDPDWIHDHGGLDAAQEARDQGKARWIGFHAEKSPHIALKLLARGDSWDAVLMPLNPFDASFRSFERQVLPEVIRRGAAVIGTRPLAAGAIPGCRVVRVEEAYRYAWSLPVTTVLAGLDSDAIWRRTQKLALGFKPFHAGEMDALRQKARVLAGDGRYERYKTTQDFDGAPGRAAHGFDEPLVGFEGGGVLAERAARLGESEQSRREKRREFPLSGESGVAVSCGGGVAARGLGLGGQQFRATTAQVQPAEHRRRPLELLDGFVELAQAEMPHAEEIVEFAEFGRVGDADPQAHDRLDEPRDGLLQAPLRDADFRLPRETPQLVLDREVRLGEQPRHELYRAIVVRGVAFERSLDNAPDHPPAKIGLMLGQRFGAAEGLVRSVEAQIRLGKGVDVARFEGRAVALGFEVRRGDVAVVLLDVRAEGLLCPVEGASHEEVIARVGGGTDLLIAEVGVDLAVQEGNSFGVPLVGDQGLGIGQGSAELRAGCPEDRGHDPAGEQEQGDDKEPDLPRASECVTKPLGS